MKKVLTVLTITILLVVMAGYVFAEEMAKEGTTSGKLIVTGKSQALSMGQQRVQMNYDVCGVIVTDDPKSPFNNRPIHAIGSLHAIKGDFQDSGFMVTNFPNGDKVFSTYKASGNFMTGAKGTYTYVGGTGKFEGIQGSGEFTRHSLGNATEDTWTSLNIMQINYKLP